MRFRHKLSIVLVGLAIIPLAATGVLIATLLEHDQITRVDNRVAVSAAAPCSSGYDRHPDPRERQASVR
jgi:hypothetical protein